MSAHRRFVLMWLIGSRLRKLFHYLSEVKNSCNSHQETSHQPFGQSVGSYRREPKMSSDKADLFGAGEGSGKRTANF